MLSVSPLPSSHLPPNAFVSTSFSFQMLPSYFTFFLLVLATPYFPTPAFSSQSIECVFSSHPQTRTFPSLLDLQHNSQSFKVNGAGYAGNSIDFSFKSLDKIPRNAFISFTSQYIWKITLRGKHIEQIDDGAFVNLNCLHVLDLGDNSLRTITEGTFEKLGNLATLKLDGNLLTELGNLVFRELGGLKHLDLSRNRVEAIGVEAFEGLRKLESLDLGRNLLRTVHPETFAPLGSLTSLQLNSNRIQKLETHLWKNLTKLITLNLADNSLTSFDPGYNFSFASLKFLNLSMNDLTKLNVHDLRRHLPSLTTIDLNGNPWLCEDLASIVPALRDSRITYTQTQNKAVRNEHGIPCNYNPVTYRERTTTELVTLPATKPISNNKTNVINVLLEQHLQNATLELQKALGKSNQEVFNSMEKTQNLIVALMVLVLIFIALELTFRTGLINRVIRRRRDDYILNDDISLLTT